MKENNLFKQVSDRQMPDLEAIRNACIEQKPQEKKGKIIRFGTTRIIAVAAICALLATGMIAVFANPGGMFFTKQPEVTVTETTKVAKITTPTKPTKSKKAETTIAGNGSHSTIESDEVEEITELTEEERLIKYLKKSDIYVNKLSSLGEFGEFTICYATGITEETYSCDYIIGNYTFSCTTQCTPYGLGIYAVEEDQCFTLDEVYSQDVFEDFNELVQLIENSELEITVTRNDSDSEAIMDYFDIDTVSVANVGELDGGRLLYRTDDDYTGEFGTEFFGDYEFSYIDAQETYALGFYFIENGVVYTLSDAVEQGKITDIDRVVELVNELKTKTAVKVFITTEEEPTTGEEIEEPIDGTDEE